MRKITMFALTATVLIGAIIADTMPHECYYKHCPFKGQSRHVNTHGCEEGSDCYYLDKIHFEHPTWDYDQCEAYLFSAPECAVCGEVTAWASNGDGAVNCKKHSL